MRVTLIIFTFFALTGSQKAYSQDLGAIFNLIDINRDLNRSNNSPINCETPDTSIDLKTYNDLVLQCMNDVCGPTDANPSIWNKQAQIPNTDESTQQAGTLAPKLNQLREAQGLTKEIEDDILDSLRKTVKTIRENALDLQNNPENYANLSTPQYRDFSLDQFKDYLSIEIINDNNQVTYHFSPILIDSNSELMNEAIVEYAQNLNQNIQNDLSTQIILNFASHPDSNQYILEQYKELIQKIKELEGTIDQEIFDEFFSFIIHDQQMNEFLEEVIKISINYDPFRDPDELFFHHILQTYTRLLSDSLNSFAENPNISLEDYETLLSTGQLGVKTETLAYCGEKCRSYFDQEYNEDSIKQLSEQMLKMTDDSNLSELIRNCSNLFNSFVPASSDALDKMVNEELPKMESFIKDEYSNQTAQFILSQFEQKLTFKIQEHNNYTSKVKARIITDIRSLYDEIHYTFTPPTNNFDMTISDSPTPSNQVNNDPYHVINFFRDQFNIDTNTLTTCDNTPRKGHDNAWHNSVNLSGHTLSNEHPGNSTLLHELTHVLTITFKSLSDQMSHDSVEHYKQQRQCVSDFYNFGEYYINENELSKNDTIKTEENFADAIAFNLNQSPSVGSCQFIKEDPQTNQYIPENYYTLGIAHSTGLFRIIHELIAKELEIPSSCQEIIDINIDLGVPKKCF